MTAEHAVTGNQQIHLPVIYAVCPEGHKTGTQKPSGSRVKCSQCAQQVTVPLRDGAAPPKRAPEMPPALQRTAD